MPTTLNIAGFRRCQASVARGGHSPWSGGSRSKHDRPRKDGSGWCGAHRFRQRGTSRHPEGLVLKTYNHIHCQVTHHPSAKQQALEPTLRGECWELKAVREKALPEDRHGMRGFRIITVGTSMAWQACFLYCPPTGRTSMDRYVGVDSHARSCTLIVVSASDRRLESKMVETNGHALVEAVRLIPGRCTCAWKRVRRAPGSTSCSSHTSRRSWYRCPQEQGRAGRQTGCLGSSAGASCGSGGDASLQGSAVFGGGAGGGASAQLRGYGRGSGQEPLEGCVSESWDRNGQERVGSGATRSALPATSGFRSSIPRWAATDAFAVSERTKG